MSALSDAQLLRHLCGADHPEERADLRARIAEDARLQARVAALERELQPPSQPRTRWPLPPPGRGSLALHGASRAMGGAAGHALVFEDCDEDARIVVVLWNTGSGWEVLTPMGPDDALRPDALPQDARGRRVVDVVLPERRSAWAIALPRDAAGPDWSAADPWARFRTALFAGEVPVQVIVLSSAADGD